MKITKNTKVLFLYLTNVIRCFKQNERTNSKKYDPARTRTWNLLIRSQTPYPLGHEADMVYKEFYCYFTINCITNMDCNTVILCLHLNEESDSRDFYSFFFRFFCTLQILSLQKVLDWCFPWSNFFWIVLVNVVNCTAFNLGGFKNICLFFNVATKTISN